jgi:hypothetical protein
LNNRIIKKHVFLSVPYRSISGLHSVSWTTAKFVQFEYNQQLLNEALEAGIEVIGLADHGSVDR